MIRPCLESLDPTRAGREAGNQEAFLERADTNKGTIHIHIHLVHPVRGPVTIMPYQLPYDLPETMKNTCQTDGLARNKTVWKRLRPQRAPTMGITHLVIWWYVIIVLYDVHYTKLYRRSATTRWNHGTSSTCVEYLLMYSIPLLRPAARRKT